MPNKLYFSFENQMFFTFSVRLVVGAPKFDRKNHCRGLWSRQGRVFNCDITKILKDNTRNATCEAWKFDESCGYIFIKLDYI